MKIHKIITVETEVEVDVSAEDIASMFEEADPISERQALMMINNIAKAMKGIIPAMIERIGEPARKEIAKFFAEQAVRFSVDDNMKSSGQVVIDAVIRAGAIDRSIKAETGDIFVWSANAVEQIEAALEEAGYKLIKK